MSQENTRDVTRKGLVDFQNLLKTIFLSLIHHVLDNMWASQTYFESVFGIVPSWFSCYMSQENTRDVTINCLVHLKICWGLYFSWILTQRLNYEDILGTNMCLIYVFEDV